MNKDKYKRTFSAVHPSDETVERILEMPEKNRKKVIPRKLVMVLAVLTTITGGMLTANAATDGAVLDGTLFKDIRMVVNGKEADASPYIKKHETTQKDGLKIDTYEIEVPGDKEQQTGSYVIASDSDSGYTVNPTFEIDTDKQEAALSVGIEEKNDSAKEDSSTDQTTAADNSAADKK